VASASEVVDTFACFGSRCSVAIGGSGALGTAEEAVAMARSYLLEWHGRFSRFDQGSELVALNRDPRETVPVSPMMARFASAAVAAAEATGGLVDATLLAEIEDAGYDTDHDRALPIALALGMARPRQPGGPSAASRWRTIGVDLEALTVRRPPGVMLDSGGIAKGLFADALGEMLAEHDSYAVDCAGDIRLGGVAGLERPVRVASPFDERVIHEFRLSAGGVATSGIAKRSWLDAHGRPAHHLLDPATGLPAFTGLVQVTALAPTALEAETLAKAALLSGPDGAAGWLRHGGLVVLEDGPTRPIGATPP
jgi:thiamine biosynthesis lipoprotein